MPALRDLLIGKDTRWRDHAIRFLESDPLFKLDYNHTKESLRQITRARVHRLCTEGFITVNDGQSYGCPLCAPHC